MTKDLILRAPQENANDHKIKVVTVNSRNLNFVSKGDLLFQLETSKSIVEYESPSEGFFTSFVNAGEDIEVGKPIGAISKEKILVKTPTQDSLIPIDNLNIRFSKKALDLIAQHQIDKNVFDGLQRVSEADVEKFLSLRINTISRLSAEEELTLIHNANYGPDHIILFGAGLQAEVVLDLLESCGRLDKLLFIIDSNPRISKLHGVSVIGPSSLGTIRELGGKNIHICIGNPSAKRDVANKLLDLGFIIVSLIHPSSSVSKFATIGPGVYVGPMVNIGPYVVIGAYSQINNCSSVAHHSKLGECVMISDGCIIGGSVHVKSDAHLGLSVSVNRDLVVGMGASVPTGERVLNNIADGEVIKFNKRSIIK